MRRIDNPPNPYDSVHRQWLGPPPRSQVEVYEEQARSILSRNESPDVGFEWSLNPYRGCQHACSYCYARRTHEYLGFGAGSDFESRLVAKVNAPDLLERALARPRWRGDRIAFSGVTDCYQALEVSYELTRRCLEICRRHANPVAIVTKSALVARDADLLRAIERDAGASVYFSLATMDPEIGRVLEPGAPPAEARLRAMQELAGVGVPVAVLVAPIIPGLTDTSIPEVLERARDHGARAARCLLLRLPGSVQSVFLERLERDLPLRAGHVARRLRDVRSGSLSDSRFGHRMTGQGPYWESVHSLFRVHARRLGLAGGKPVGGLEEPERSRRRRSVPPGYLPFDEAGPTPPLGGS